MYRCFLDMDGVLADFDRLKNELGISGDELVEREGAFRDLQPVAGAIDAVAKIEAMGFTVFIATRPAPSHPATYADKVTWILQHLPRLRKHVIMTQDKGLLGDDKDVLIDDRPEKANCLTFPGLLIPFQYGHPQAWDNALKMLVEHGPKPVQQAGVPWECMEGWSGLIRPLEDLCRKHDVQITQIKEKFGGLRFYTAQQVDAVDDAISKAEAASFHICERCGQPGSKRRSASSWLKTLCEEHTRDWLSGRLA